MKFEPILSVIIISYKQEKYIREAIESVLNQKTEYKYELLLADDCSPDKTLEIMEEYATKYPKIIKLLKREKNLGANNNLLDAYSKCKGKYVTFLEGDDYWCDKNKIQKQIDFLEKHTEYIGVSHTQEGRKNNVVVGYFPKKLNEDMIIDGLDDLIKNEKTFSFSSTIHKNLYLNEKWKKDIIYLHSLDSTISDSQMCDYLCFIGKIYVMNEGMMVYRIRNNDGNSNFNSSHKINEIQLRYLKIYLEEEKFYNEKYSFYNKIKERYTLGIAYNLLHGNFKEIKDFKRLCPKKYRLRINLVFPITCCKILWRRFIKNRGEKK